MRARPRPDCASDSQPAVAPSRPNRSQAVDPPRPWSRRDLCAPVGRRSPPISAIAWSAASVAPATSELPAWRASAGESPAPAPPAFGAAGRQLRRAAAPDVGSNPADDPGGHRCPAVGDGRRRPDRASRRLGREPAPAQVITVGAGRRRRASITGAGGQKNPFSGRLALGDQGLFDPSCRPPPHERDHRARRRTGPSRRRRPRAPTRRRGAQKEPTNFRASPAADISSIPASTTRRRSPESTHSLKPKSPGREGRAMSGKLAGPRPFPEHRPNPQRKATAGIKQGNLKNRRPRRPWKSSATRKGKNYEEKSKNLPNVVETG